jgi:predicted PurR-regulated permease PerM
MTEKNTAPPASHPVSAIRLLIWGAFGVLLYLAHAAFIPIALALLFGLILSGPVESLHKMRVPRSLSALLILVLVLSVLGSVGFLVKKPAEEWFAKAPQTLAMIKKAITPIANAVNHVEDLRKDASGIGAEGHAQPGNSSAAAPESAPALLVDVGAPALAAALCFVIVTLFLLTGGPPMMARMTSAFADNLQSSHVLHVIEKVRGEVGHYYVTTTFINIGLGTATGLAMWAWRMPSPYLWGALAAVLNYIPYAGPGTTLVVITLVATASFSSLSHVLGAAGSYIIIAMIEGQIAQPLLVGRRMEINPLLIFLALWFGGLFWGIAGIILATPTLVALKVIAENTKNGRPMRDFLGPNKPKHAGDATLKQFLQ